MQQQILQKRLENKQKKLNEDIELLKFFSGKPCNLPLKKVLEIRKAQLGVGNNKNDGLINQDIFFNEKVKLNNELKLLKFKSKLKVCGNLLTHNYYCKQCEGAGNPESLLAFRKEIHTCDIRYCDKNDCIIHRFAETFNSLLKTPRIQNLRTLHHFAIGFEKISEFDFKNNFDKIKKKHEYVMNNFFKRLRKIGIKIQGYKVLDISKGKRTSEWDHKYYVHYHFAAIPFKKADVREITTKIQAVRKDMIEKQKVKIPFHYQSFKLKEKESVLAYLACRCIGLYKPFEEKEVDYDIYAKISLRDSLEKNLFMKLNSLLNHEQYLKYFFGSRHLSNVGNYYFCFGCQKEIPLKTYKKNEIKICPKCKSKDVVLAFLRDIRYGSNTADNIIWVCCKFHGRMLSNDLDKIRHEIFIDGRPPPDDVLFKKNKVYLVNALHFQKVSTKDNYEPFSRHKIDMKLTVKIPKFEDLEIKELIEKNTMLKSGRSVHDHKKDQKRLQRLLNKDKIKLSFSDRLELTLKGVV